MIVSAAARWTNVLARAICATNCFSYATTRSAGMAWSCSVKAADASTGSGSATRSTTAQNSSGDMGAAPPVSRPAGVLVVAGGAMVWVPGASDGWTAVPVVLWSGAYAYQPVPSTVPT